MGRVVDMLGARCGRLVVTGRAENNRRGQARWFCRCSCENETIVVGNNLRNGSTKSCGCFREEVLEGQQQKSFKHGHGRRNKRTSIYTRWKNARHWGKTDLSFSEFIRQQQTAAQKSV